MSAFEHVPVLYEETLEALSAELPHVRLRYAWPFDLDDVAELFARGLDRL